MDQALDSTYQLGRGLAGYVRAVAAALDLPAQGTSSEVSDTATAYLALRPRGSGDELMMLVWSERHGWAVAVETGTRGESSVLAYFGDDAVPEPSVVAEFVREVLGGRRDPGRRPAFSTDGNRAGLTERLQPYW